MDKDSLHADVLHALDAAHVPYRVVRHAELPNPVGGPQDVARALGYDVGRITKTLLLKASDSSLVVIAVLPAAGRANLRLVATHLGAPRCSVATAQQLEQTLGYPPGGVSPFSTRAVNVLIDSQLKQYETLLVGGGRVGVEVELSPESLAEASHGEWLSLSQ